MARTPHAAKQLLAEVRTEHPKATLTPVDEPDGFGTHRSFRLSKAASEMVSDHAEDIIDDHRIHTVKGTKDGCLILTFVAGTAADDRTPYGIAD
jgi:hypothetical protein